MPQQPIELILMRQLANYLSMPVFLVGADEILLYYNEAAEALYYNVATKEDLDLAMTKGVNYPKGLLKWCDEIGAGVVLDTLNGLREKYSEERYRPGVLLKEMAKEKATFYV